MKSGSVTSNLWLRQEREEVWELDESEQVPQINDFRNSESEKRRAEQCSNREFLASQAEVLIKEKLSKIGFKLFST